MSHVLSAALLAASANIDNLGVGVAYGVARRRIRPAINVLIALVSGGATLMSMAVGEWVNDFLSEKVAELLGGGFMVAIGVASMALAVRGGDRPAAEPSPRATPPVVGPREAAALAVSLTINNLAVGVGAGLSHVDVGLTTGLTMAASVAAIAAGGLLGRRAAMAISNRWLGVASGLLLVGVGIHECLV